MIRINQLKVPIFYTEDTIREAVCKKLKINKADILSLSIARRSIDARKKPDLIYVLTVDVKLAKDNESKVLKHKDNDISSLEEIPFKFPQNHGWKKPIYIVGSGPCGYFCAYYLLQYGYNVVIIERGEAVDKRSDSVDCFWHKGDLNSESNVQFGEGGAGTFSDGKLNTLIKDKDGLMHRVLSDYVKFGASSEILYDSKPHIGTDVLRNVVVKMRKEIEALGGTVRFNTKLTDIKTIDGHITGIILNDSEYVECEMLVLAIGHSARDTFEMLHRNGIFMESKSFAVGFRVEHPQDVINVSQYGQISPDVLDALGPATYKVTHQEDGIGIYSFCMCPGGYVVNSSSEEGMLAINGMSYSKRDGKYANSAIIMTVDREEFESEHPLSGILFQRNLEKKAFSLSNGAIPCQYFKDFLKDVPSQEEAGHEPAIRGAYAFTNLRPFFSKKETEAFISAMKRFGQMIEDYDDDYAILSVVESRTSSPVRITRNTESFMSNVYGIYPAGEGAGYAGGITSAAMDGIKTALHIAQNINNEMDNRNEQ